MKKPCTREKQVHGFCEFSGAVSEKNSMAVILLTGGYMRSEKNSDQRLCEMAKNPPDFGQKPEQMDFFEWNRSEMSLDSQVEL